MEKAIERKIFDLTFLFRVVAIVEAVYFLLGILTPPSRVQSVIGWVLTPDGHWITKLMSVSLAAQAWLAWSFRDRPYLEMARPLAFYQLASATVDWVMWATLGGDGIFSTTAGKISVIASIPTHYLIGMILIVAIRKPSPHFTLK